MFYPFFASLRTKAFLLSVIIFSFTFSGCFSSQSAKDADAVSLPAEEEDSGFTFSPPNINLANPLVVSQKPEDAAMCDRINQTIDKSPLSNARWGVFAVSLKDGRVVCARDGRKLFNPASIQKTLTAVVALEKLGADFRWKTSVYAENAIDADGTLNGNLILYGEGAPDFDAEALENLVAQLQAKGLKRVKGKLFGDESYFRGDTIGDGWTWNELQWYYGAEASALSFNDNQAFINIENGTPRTSTDYIQVRMGKAGEEGNANISANKEASGIKRGLSDNEFYVWGKAKTFGARVAVHNPALMAAKALKESLKKKGIEVAGEVESRDWKSDERPDLTKLTELASVQSQTLGEIVKKMNKHSNNLYAELILRTIGKKFSDSVPDDIQLPQNVRGDDTTGAAIIKKWLTEHNVATEEIQIYDGSGLSRLDFVTPEAFARAFIYAAQSPFASVFIDSLPVAATDGTLGGRLGKAKGRIAAKTGSITYVNSLAGYAAGKDETFAFVIIANNVTAKKGVTNVIDDAAMQIIGESVEEDKKTPGKQANSNQQNDFYHQNIAGGN